MAAPRKPPTKQTGTANEATARQAAEKLAADTERYESLAREHGANLSEEGFNEALRKVGRRTDGG